MRLAFLKQFVLTAPGFRSLSPQEKSRIAPKGTDRPGYGEEKIGWDERRARREELRGRWNFIRSRPPDQEGAAPQCFHMTEDVRRCTYQCTPGTASYRAPLPPYCRFHLLVDYVGVLAPLLKGDPEAITEDFSIGCLGMLVNERLQGGPRAEEAHTAIVAICEELKNSYTEGRGSH